MGLPPELVAELDAQETTSNLLPLRSSLDGVVVDRKAVDGEVVDSKIVLFDVADTSRLWLNAGCAAGGCEVHFARPDGTISRQR